MSEPLQETAIASPNDTNLSKANGDLVGENGSRELKTDEKDGSPTVVVPSSNGAKNGEHSNGEHNGEQQKASTQNPEPPPAEFIGFVDDSDATNDDKSAFENMNGHCVKQEVKTLEEDMQSGTETQPNQHISSPDDEDFGEFNDAHVSQSTDETQTPNEKEKAENQETDDDFGDFNKPSNTVKDQQIENIETNENGQNQATEDDFGDFNQPSPVDEQLPNLHDKGDNNQPKDDQLGDFDDSNQHPPTEDANEENPTLLQQKAETEDNFDNSADFKQSPETEMEYTAKAVENSTSESGAESDFGDFNQASTEDKAPQQVQDSKDDDFGDFNYVSTENEAPQQATVQVTQPTEDDDFGDFGDFNQASTENEAPQQEPTVQAPQTAQSPEDDFGGFDQAPTEDKAPEQDPKDGDFGDFGDFNQTSTGDNVSQQEATVQVTQSTQPTENDGFGDFGDFNQASTENEAPQQATVEAPQTTQSTEEDDFGDFAQVSSENKAPEQETTVPAPEDDDFGDFGDFNQASAEDNAPEQAAVQATQPNHPTEDDGFGDFGDFKQVSAEDKAPQQATVKAPQTTQSTEDDFGDFGDFSDFKDSSTTANQQEEPSSGDDFGDFANSSTEVNQSTSRRIEPVSSDQAQEWGDFGQGEANSQSIVEEYQDEYAQQTKARLEGIFSPYPDESIVEQSGEPDETSEVSMAGFLASLTDKSTSNEIVRERKQNAATLLVQNSPKSIDTEPQLTFNSDVVYPLSLYSSLIDAIQSIADISIRNKSKTKVSKKVSPEEVLQWTETSDVAEDETSDADGGVDEAPADMDIKLDFTDFKAPKKRFWQRRN